MDPALTEVTPVPGGIAVRTFTDAGISAAIDKALAELPADRKGAVIAYADLTGAKLAVMARLDPHWSVVAVADYDWATRKPEAGAEVRFTW